MSIITYPLNNIIYDATDAETYLCSRTSGVFSSENCFTATATGTNRNITISKGLAWIKNDDFTGKSICNTDNINITVPISNGNLPRIDRIVLRFDSNANSSSIALKQGTPASLPQAPNISRTPTLYELALCDINIPAGSIFVSQGDIIPKLLDENVCGLMSDGVNKIPTQALLDKFESDFNNWFDDLQEQLSGDVATNLQNQINEIKKVIASYDEKYIQVSEKGQANGVASLDISGKVLLSQLPAMNFIPTSEKGTNNGVATLKSNGKIPNSQLPIGNANGIAPLDTDSKVPLANLPDIGEKLYLHCMTYRLKNYSGSSYSYYTCASIYVISEKSNMTDGDIWEWIYNLSKKTEWPTEEESLKLRSNPYPAFGYMYDNQNNMSIIQYVEAYIDTLNSVHYFALHCVPLNDSAYSYSSFVVGLSDTKVYTIPLFS